MPTLSAKDIRVAIVDRKHADECVRRWHYSGKPYVKSQLHFGVWLDGKLCGAMQFGPSIDTSKTLTLVSGTRWTGYLELNRMAFSDALPRNSESRALGVALRMIRAKAPHVDWVLSYADATRCGDGSIYRAAGFLLTGIKKNTSLWTAPDGQVISDVGLRTSPNLQAKYKCSGRPSEMMRAGLRPIPGYQLRYIKFINDQAKHRLSVPIIPYSQIPDSVRMYRGLRVESRDSAAADDQSAEGGAMPTSTLNE